MISNSKAIFYLFIKTALSVKLKLRSVKQFYLICKRSEMLIYPRFFFVPISFYFILFFLPWVLSLLSAVSSSPLSQCHPLHTYMHRPTELSMQHTCLSGAAPSLPALTRPFLFAADTLRLLPHYAQRTKWVFSTGRSM